MNSIINHTNLLIQIVAIVLKLNLTIKENVYLLIFLSEKICSTTVSINFSIARLGDFFYDFIKCIVKINLLLFQNIDVVCVPGRISARSQRRKWVQEFSHSASYFKT